MDAPRGILSRPLEKLSLLVSQEKEFSPQQLHECTRLFILCKGLILHGDAVSRGLNRHKEWTLEGNLPDSQKTAQVARAGLSLGEGDRKSVAEFTIHDDEWMDYASAYRIVMANHKKTPNKHFILAFKTKLEKKDTGEIEEHYFIADSRELPRHDPKPLTFEEAQRYASANNNGPNPAQIIKLKYKLGRYVSSLLLEEVYGVGMNYKKRAEKYFALLADMRKHEPEILVGIDWAIQHAHTDTKKFVAEEMPKLIERERQEAERQKISQAIQNEMLRQQALERERVEEDFKLRLGIDPIVEGDAFDSDFDDIGRTIATFYPKEHHLVRNVLINCNSAGKYYVFESDNILTEKVQVGNAFVTKDRSERIVSFNESDLKILSEKPKTYENIEAVRDLMNRRTKENYEKARSKMKIRIIEPFQIDKDVAQFIKNFTRSNNKEALILEFVKLHGAGKFNGPLDFKKAWMNMMKRWETDPRVYTILSAEEKAEAERKVKEQKELDLLYQDSTEWVQVSIPKEPVREQETKAAAADEWGVVEGTDTVSEGEADEKREFEKLQREVLSKVTIFGEDVWKELGAKVQPTKLPDDMRAVLASVDPTHPKDKQYETCCPVLMPGGGFKEILQLPRVKIIIEKMKLLYDSKELEGVISRSEDKPYWYLMPLKPIRGEIRKLYLYDFEDFTDKKAARERRDTVFKKNFDVPTLKELIVGLVLFKYKEIDNDFVTQYLRTALFLKCKEYPFAVLYSPRDLSIVKFEGNEQELAIPIVRRFPE